MDRTGHLCIFVQASTIMEDENSANMEVLVPIRSGSSGPYAPPAAVLEVIRGFRDRGLTVPFTPDVLIRAGVSESLVPRTLKSLEVLELVDDTGMPTPILEGLRRATSEEYRQRLAEWLRAVYVEVFNFVDPATAPVDRVADAFRAFDPIGQRGRMVSLFLGLCVEAGIVAENTIKKSLPTEARRKPTTPRRPPTPAMPGQGPGFAAGKINLMNNSGGWLPPAIGGLIAALPNADTGWTKKRRDEWVRTFETVLDFSIPIRKEAEANAALLE